MKKKKEIKRLHDEIISYFGLGKSKLLAFMYQWREQKTAGSPTCMWPEDPQKPGPGRGYEIAIYNKHMAGPTRSGIFLKRIPAREALAVINEINQSVFDLNYGEAGRIVTSNRTNQERKKEILLNKALSKYVAQLPAEKILSTPGVYDPIKEEYGKEAEEIVKLYQADPGINNIEIKYDTRELLEMAISDIESAIDVMKGMDDQELKHRIDSLQKTVSISKRHLKAMDQIREGESLR